MTRPINEEFEINSVTSAGNLYTAPSYPVGSSPPLAADATAAGAAPIVSAAQTTIVLVTSISVQGTGFANTGSTINLGGIVQSGISLPADAEIGDVVEVYAVATASPSDNGGVNIWAPVGENLNGNLNGFFGISGQPQNGGGTAFRKIDASNWYII
jgi:hypothetical protein